jgi:hypothetical protein
MTFLDCPAYLSHDGRARCGLPAEITNRYTLPATDEPVECATIRCPSRHWFNGPLDALALPDPSARNQQQSDQAHQAQAANLS